MTEETNTWKCNSCRHVAEWQTFQCDDCNADGCFESGQECQNCNATGFLCPECGEVDIDIYYKEEHQQKENGK